MTTLATMRKCSKCEEVFPATEEYFYKLRVNSSGKMLLRGDCKKCKGKQYSCPDATKKAIAVRYYEKNKERLKMKARQRYDENKEKKRKEYLDSLIEGTTVKIKDSGKVIH